MPHKSSTTAPTRTVSVSRSSRPTVAFKDADMSKVCVNDEQEEDDEIDEAEPEGDEDNMLEMISILQEFQKRKATKTSSRSAAFQSKKNALYKDARVNADIVVTEGIAYIEQFKTKITEMKAQELAQEQSLRSIALATHGLDEPVKATLGFYPNFFDDLAHRRAAEINDASEMLETHSAGRQLSRRRLIENAKDRMDDSLEEQRLATDASALIKHYKALLLS